MNSFYSVTQSVFEQLKSAGFNDIFLGEIYDTDLERQTIFPYAVIVPQTSTLPDNVDSITLLVVGMDLVDFSKASKREREEPFFGIDNVQDVLNDIHNRLSLISEYYKRGPELFELDGDASFDPFLHRFENLLYGWELTITIKLPANTPIC